ncbi:caspase family protein [Streptomyces sp. NPDC002187]|uniref:caspase family protein n=1 Tax=Streptomyces sp. NPDC002187 TaxID=3364637 RepID=UPI003677D7F7
MTVTSDTRNRLELAANNERPIGPREPHRSAVRAVQSALADLNKGYLRGNEVDGYYGARTAAAVELFQREYGLYADGVAGRQTMVQLDALYAPGVVRAPLGMSVHVGVDQVDAAHYGGEFRLKSCANDARAMQATADALGYRSLLLTNDQATTGNFVAFLRHCSASLFPGDTLLVSFSGHGSQIPDNGWDSEADGLDETLCFYDRMLVDDEVHALLATLREGVRVIAVFDSCHSGTVAKQLDLSLTEEIKRRRTDHLARLTVAATANAARGMTAESGGAPVSTVPLTDSELDEALGDSRAEAAVRTPASRPAAEKVLPGPDRLPDRALAFLADLYADGTTGEGKSIDDFGALYDKHHALYDALRETAGPKEHVEVLASVVTLSACDDAQTTPAGSIYSLFTYNVLATWRSGAFTGNYGQLHKALRDRSRADATPVLNTYGRATDGLLSTRPFFM